MTLVAGIDLGSTGLKVLIAEQDRQVHEVARAQVPTPWRTGAGGRTDLTADALVDALAALLAQAAERVGGRRVCAVAIAGMGESGYLVDRSGAALAPAPAWFDPRGSEQLAAFPRDLAAQFPGRTGLPLGVQVSATKLLHLRDAGIALHGARFASLPEWAVHALGGELVAEHSLAGRTGLIDQDTGRPWPELLEHLGVDASLLPPLTASGTPAGTASAPWLPACFRGATLTVAGHDHLVAATAVDALASDRYHVSLGTAEVLTRTLDSPLTYAARERLGMRLINVVRHVVPDRWALVAGVKTGLLLRRALRLFGIADAAARDKLDAAVMRIDGPLPALEVSGARNDDGALRLAVLADDVTPAAVFEAVLRHSNDELRVLIDAIDRELPPATSALLTGGWTSLRSVRRARSAILPDLQVSEREQDTAFGAALIAARLTRNVPTHEGAS